mgnify:CR=1 FL=1
MSRASGSALPFSAKAEIDSLFAPVCRKIKSMKFFRTKTAAPCGLTRTIQKMFNAKMQRREDARHGTILIRNSTSHHLVNRSSCALFLFQLGDLAAWRPCVEFRRLRSGLKRLPKVISKKVGQTCRFAWNRRSDSLPFRKLLLASSIIP